MSFSSCGFVIENIKNNSSTSPLLAISAPASIDDGTITTDLTTTTSITWSAVAGASSYEIAIGTTVRGTDVLTWTNVGNVTSYSNSSVSLNDGIIYFVSVRAVSSIGTKSSPTDGDGFLVSLVYPRWVQEAYIKASNSEANDQFGVSLAINGNTLAISAWLEDGNETTITNGTTSSADNSSVDSGAVYVYKRTGSTWVQEAYIKAANADAADSFGQNLSLDQDTLVVSSDNEASNVTVITNGTTASGNNANAFSGAVYVYKRTGTTWAQQAYIKSSNSAAGDFFGLSLDIFRDTIVVSALGEDSNETTITNGATSSADNSAANSGAVYVYKRTGNNWAQEAYIKASNATTMDNFGTSISIFQDTVVVGESSEDSNETTITNGTTSSADNSVMNSGAVFVYKRTGVNWAQQAYIKASNAGVFDAFGQAVSISGDTIAVGSYQESSNQTTITNGTSSSVDDSNGLAGAVYIYKRTGNNWAQEAYIKASNSESGDQFGIKLSMNQDTLVVGADGEDSNDTTISNGTTASSDNSAANSGAIYIFKRTGTNWEQEAFIKASNTEAGDSFFTPSLSGDTLAVGAQYEDSNQTSITNGTTASSNNSSSSAGAVYVYKRKFTGISGWSQQAYVKAANAEVNDLFGYSVSVSGDTAVVSAAGEDSNQTTITNGTTASSDNSAGGAGAVYVYKRTGTNWAQEAYIKAANAESNDQYGEIVAISGDTIAVSATYEDSNQTTITNGTTASADNSNSESGAVYVYKRSGTTWAQQAYVKADNADVLDVLGWRMSIDGDTLAITSYLEASNESTITNGTTASADNSAPQSGAVYVYKRTGNNWAQEAYIKAANAQATDLFGVGGVSLSGDTLVVGTNGEDSNETTITNGTTASADNSASSSGAAYVYKRTGVNWAQEAYIKASNAEASDFFGASVAVSGDTIVVGANGEASNETTITNGATSSADNSSPNRGAVYVYKRAGVNWAQEAYIKPVNGNTNDSFGTTVAISNDTIVVGVQAEDSNETSITNGTTASANNAAADSGAVYVYKRTGVNWAQEAYIKSANSEANDDFGKVVGISGDTIIVGAPGEDSNQTSITNGITASSNNGASSSGAAYIYIRNYP